MNAFNSTSDWKVRKPSNWSNHADHWPITFKVTLRGTKKPVPTEIWNLKAKEDDWKLYTETTDKTVVFHPEFSAEENSLSVTLAIIQAAQMTIGTVYTNPTEHPWWNEKLERMKKERKVYNVN